MTFSCLHFSLILFLLTRSPPCCCFQQSVFLRAYFLFFYYCIVDFRSLLRIFCRKVRILFLFNRGGETGKGRFPGNGKLEMKERIVSAADFTLFVAMRFVNVITGSHILFEKKYLRIVKPMSSYNTNMRITYVSYKRALFIFLYDRFILFYPLSLTVCFSLYTPCYSGLARFLS